MTLFAALILIALLLTVVSFFENRFPLIQVALLLTLLALLLQTNLLTS